MCVSVVLEVKKGLAMMGWQPDKWRGMRPWCMCGVEEMSEVGRHGGEAGEEWA